MHMSGSQRFGGPRRRQDPPWPPQPPAYTLITWCNECAIKMAAQSLPRCHYKGTRSLPYRRPPLANHHFPMDCWQWLLSYQATQLHWCRAQRTQNNPQTAENFASYKWFFFCCCVWHIWYLLSSFELRLLLTSVTSPVSCSVSSCLLSSFSRLLFLLIFLLFPLLLPLLLFFFDESSSSFLLSFLLSCIFF